MSSSTSSTLYDGKPLSSHGRPLSCDILHDGKPLSSHGYPRPFDRAYHGKRFMIYTRKRGLYSYKPAQISSSLIRYIKQLHNLDPKIKRMQKQARGLRQWKRLELGWYKLLGTEDLLHAYSKCFDNLFFAGLLKGFYKIRFVDDTSIKDRLGKCASHRHANNFSFGHPYEIDIEIVEIHKPSQLKNYLGTLLHEMTHAVFELYCCYSCSECIGRFDDELGRLGHAMLWQNLSISISNVLDNSSDFAPTGTIEVGRSESFHYEYWASKKLQSSLTIRQLGRLNLQAWTTHEIRRHIQARDKKQRATTQSKNAAARGKKPKSKTDVLGGRDSRSGRSNSRH